MSLTSSIMKLTYCINRGTLGLKISYLLLEKCKPTISEEMEMVLTMVPTMVPTIVPTYP